MIKGVKELSLHRKKKRLALIRCYLEDSPIYLFHEFAADQDPGFRQFFYRDLLIKMKQKGKIVIAITHDDHYFNVDDKIIKLDMGSLDFCKDRKNGEITKLMTLNNKFSQEEKK